LFLVSALSLAKSLIDRKEGDGLKGVLSAHCENVRIDWERAMVTRILLAAILCLMPAYAAAQTDTGPRRDIAAIHHLIEQYAKAVDTVDLKLLSQIWSHSPEVSFIIHVNGHYVRLEIACREHAAHYVLKHLLLDGIEAVLLAQWIDERDLGRVRPDLLE